MLARGRTGSGKTIAFGAPLVESVLRAQAGQRREFGRAPKALILAPTRELALQIDRTIQPIARSVGLFTTQIYGGVPQGRQVGALKKGVDIIIGTPGRIEDLIEQGKLDLSRGQHRRASTRPTTCASSDSSSRCSASSATPRDGSQKLLFSATLDREVAALVDEFLVEPAVYEVAGEDQDSSTIDHRILVIEHRDKAEILDSLVDRDGKTLVFARTRAYAEMLAEQFDDAGIPALALHGDLNQAKRTRNLEKLTSGRVNVLVATDVAARGIHVDDIDLVVQADAPDEYKTYLHRSGRTGRAGRSGTRRDAHHASAPPPHDRDARARRDRRAVRRGPPRRRPDRGARRPHADRTPRSRRNSRLTLKRADPFEGRRVSVRGALCESGGAQRRPVASEQRLEQLRRPRRTAERAGADRRRGPRHPGTMHPSAPGRRRRRPWRPTACRCAGSRPLLSTRRAPRSPACRGRRRR